MCGGNDFFSTIENGMAQPFNLLSATESKYQQHVINVLNARLEMQHRDARNVIATSLSRNLRPHNTRIPDIGNAIHMEENGRWHSGWRMAGMIAPNAIIDKDNKLMKTPSTRIRMADRSTDEARNFPGGQAKELPSSSVGALKNVSGQSELLILKGHSLDLGESVSLSSGNLFHAKKCHLRYLEMVFRCNPMLMLSAQGVDLRPAKKPVYHLFQSLFNQLA